MIGAKVGGLLLAQARNLGLQAAGVGRRRAQRCARLLGGVASEVGEDGLGLGRPRRAQRLGRVVVIAIIERGQLRGDNRQQGLAGVGLVHKGKELRGDER